MNVITVLGSPLPDSTTAALATLAEAGLRTAGIHTERFTAQDFDAQALLFGHFDHYSVREFQQRLRDADGVIVATPVYQASFSGLLKLMLDLIPQQALADKWVLPLVSGGSAAHQLVLDYALKTVLAALGARQQLAGVYATTAQLQLLQDDPQQVRAQITDPALRERLQLALDEFHLALLRQQPHRQAQARRTRSAAFPLHNTPSGHFSPAAISR
ncbi:NADPH-dependent FMN reductase [Pokkaliibacter plantistimulans]|uniref:NADPH-dependent FMN reductase n=1 Tax=Pokkaliibacter plantistimulans TaxID=1635171 RepID=UPI000D7494B4|nr:NADPH-dependent FMN reductase [Pokkaliibacter plantistimulans]